MNEQEAIRQFMGEQPEAAQLSEWRAILERRLEGLEAERRKALATGVPASLDGKIAQLKRQIAALREEEAITSFVEDSVRVTLAMGRVTEGEPDETPEGWDG